MPEDTQPTLTDAVGRALLPFEVNHKTFYIRQPLPEEYDDADSLKTLIYQRTLKEEFTQEVANVPCSDAERMLYQTVLKNVQDRFDNLNGDADPALKDQLAAELVRLQAEIDSRTLAEEYASDKANLSRDRWLTMRLLCDDQGKPVFNLRAKDFQARWANFPMPVKDAARPVIWRALALVREAPFS